MPNHAIIGNGATTIGYTANGEASDWMLGRKSIYSFSPELGTDNIKTNEFFIEDINDLKYLVK